MKIVSWTLVAFGLSVLLVLGVAMLGDRHVRRMAMEDCYRHHPPALCREAAVDAWGDVP